MGPKSTKPTESIPVAGDFSAEAIAGVGTNLTRLIVELIPLSLRAVNTVSENLPRVLNSVTAAIEGTTAAAGSNDLGKVAGDFVNASTGLSLGIFKAVVQGLNTATQAVNANMNTPPEK